MSRQNNQKKDIQNNNLQDAAMDAEYDKGKSAGKEKPRQNGNSNKSSRRGNRGRGNNNKLAFPVNTGSKDNDPKWYTVNGQMSKDVLSLPMDINVGKPISVGTSGNNPLMMNTPGILTYRIAPVLPTSSDTLSPLNVAANAAYQGIQAKNSRTPSYEASDLMMYFVAISQAFSYYQHLVRIYGTMRNYSLVDRYTPEALVTTMGANFDDLNVHMADFRTGINQMAAALSSLYLPKAIDYCNRQIFLYESIYLDSNTNKAQYYMYVPEGFYKWIEGNTSDPQTTLSYMSLNTVQNRKASELLDFGFSLIAPLRESQDIRMMGADMIQAFGLANMYTVNPIAETFTITPGYNPEVLSQMENAFIMPPEASGSMASGVVRESTGINQGWLTSTFTYKPVDSQITTNGVTGFYTPDNYVLNFHKQDVNSDDLLVASRLMEIPQISFDVANSALSVISHNQTELIIGATMTTWLVNNGVTQLASYNFCSVMEAVTGAVYDYNVQALLAKFDWNPKVNFTKPKSSPLFTDFLWDLDNFTLMPAQLLANVNEMALLGLFSPKALGDTPQFKK